jgi:hypothetical protein
LDKYKVGDLIKTTERYKQHYKEIDLIDWGYVWDLGEVFGITASGRVKIQFFGPKPCVFEMSPESWFVEKL